MENNNYENPYSIENEETMETVVKNEKVSVTNKKKGWLIFLTILSLCNGGIGLLLVFLDDVIKMGEYIVRTVMGENPNFLLYKPHLVGSGGDLILGFVGGILAICGFVLGLIANKVARKYDNPKVIKFTMLGKIVGIAGIVLNLLVGIIFILNRF